MNSRLAFSPLSASERAAGADASREDWGTLLTPVPATSPTAPSSHFALGLPTARWAYRDASGEVLFYVSRFDQPNGGKEFLPLTLWRGAMGPRWRWKGVPTPRPVFGLEQLAARPDAPAMVAKAKNHARRRAASFPTASS